MLDMGALTSTGRDELGHIILYNDKGDEFVITHFDIRPNNYNDLCHMLQTQEVAVDLYNLTISGIDGKQYTFEVDTNLHFIHKNVTENKFYYLIEGGWIPVAYAKKKTILLLDRNVVSRIQYKYALGKKKQEDEPDYLDSLFLSDMETELDITLFALEGKDMEPPTPEQIDEQLKIAKKILGFALPDLKIATRETGDWYYHELAECTHNIIKKRMAFFGSVASKINREFTQKTRKDIVKSVFEEAEKQELPKLDIAVILVFLRIYMKGKKTPASAVIKEGQSYNERDAYNTACDLRAIEVLINYNNFHAKKSENSEYNVAFITEDIGLAKVGALFLNSTKKRSDGERTRMMATFPLDIFSDDDETIKFINEYLSN